MIEQLGNRVIDTPAALKDRLTSSTLLPIERQEVLAAIGDSPTLEDDWLPLVRTQPADLASRELMSRWLLDQGDTAGVVAMLEPTLNAIPPKNDLTGNSIMFRSLLPWLCEALAIEGRSNAEPLCNELVKKVTTSHAPRALGRIALAAHQFDEAKGKFEFALTRNISSGQTWYWLGVADSLGNHPEAARSAWQEAVRVWPDYTPALRALVAPPTSLEAARSEELRAQQRGAARSLTHCARIYASLKVGVRAERCYAAAEKLDPGMVRAIELLALPGGAAKLTPKQLAIPQKGGHPVLLAIGAEAALSRKAIKEAAELLKRADAEDPGAPEVNLAVLHLCAITPKDSLCENARLARLRAYRPVQESMQGYAVQVDSRFLGYVPPRITHFILQPYAEGPGFPEVDGLADLLEKRFPTVRFEQRAVAPTPKSAIDPDRSSQGFDGRPLGRGQIVDEYLFAAAPRERGLVMVVDRDLTPLNSNFLFGTMELETVRGIVSAARFRTDKGEPAPFDTVLTGEELKRARERLANQATSTIAKLLGLSFPCQQMKCVLRFPRSREEFDAKGGDFCPAHQEELRKLLQ